MGGNVDSQVAADLSRGFDPALAANAVNYRKATDALTILPHSVVFAFRKEKTITALPLKVPHPERALGLLFRSDASRVPAAEAFANHIRDSFAKLKHLIKRHEQAVV